MSDDFVPLASPDSLPVISVTELNRRARLVVESELPLAWVAGEISNFTRAASGHCYFTLKDAACQVRCVMFRGRAQFLDWKPANGMQVEVRAVPSFYEARGEFQLNVELMRRSGLGALYEAFARLKAKLEREGLFDAARKRELPRFPRAVGVVTSLQAAALRDVLTTLRRRMPSLPVIVYPTAVQGEGAATQIAAAIAAAGARAECDVLIVCRGGGSIEDLWSFNEEAVARAIAACPIPVVSGVGHETDFTIADFVADARAPTPTAAAELVSPSREELAAVAGRLAERLVSLTRRSLEDRMQNVDYLARRLVHPGERIRAQFTHLGHLRSRLAGAWSRDSEGRRWQVRELRQQWLALRPDVGVLEERRSVLARRLRTAAAQRGATWAARLKSLESHLAHLNPQLVLERGYSIARGADGRIVRDGAALTVGERLELAFARGRAGARVEDKS